MSLPESSPGANVLVSVGEDRERMFILALYKAIGTKPVMITAKDVDKFSAEFGLESGKEPGLIIRATEDGLMLQIMGEDQAKAFIEEYKATGKGVVANDQISKGS